MPDVGYYTLPVILSFQGIDAAVNKELGDKLKPAAKKAGEAYAKGMADGVKSGGKQVTDATVESLNKNNTAPAIAAGKKTGEEFSKATADGVKAGAPAVTKATEDSLSQVSKGGGLAKAAKDAAGEFGKGILEGVTQEIGKGGGGGLGDIIVGAATKGIQDAIKTNDAAGAFTEGLIDGIKQGLGSGAIDNAVQGVTDSLNKIGDNIGDTFQPVIDTARTVADTVGTIADAAGTAKTGLDQLKSGDTIGAMTSISDTLHGLEDLGVPKEFSDSIGDIADKMQTAKDTADGFTGTLKGLGQLAPGSEFDKWAQKSGWLGDAAASAVGLYEALDKLHLIKFEHMFDWIDPKRWQWVKDLRADIDGLNAAATHVPNAPPVSNPQVTPPTARSGHPGGRAGGGGISGPGGPTSDIIPIWASSGEHMLSAKDVAALGGQSGVYAFRNALHLAGGGGLGDAGGLLPFTSELRALVQQTWPMITTIGGYRSPDGYNEHSSGRALDVMIPNWNSPAGIALGNQIAAWALSIPGVNRVMWQQSIQSRGGKPSPLADRGSPTQNHMDHVHIFVEAMPVGATPTASMPTSPGAAGGVSAAVSSAGGTGGSGSSGGGGQDITKQFQDKAKSDAEEFAKGLMGVGETGIKETLGLGDIFPDPTQTPLYQSLMGGLGAFMGPLQGAMAGKLGIQQPGWQPGMPVDAMASGGGGSGGSIPLPFGLPSIELPPPPGPPQGGGSFAGAQTSGTVNNDLSVTYNGPVGSDPAEVRRQNGIQQDKGLAKLPMMPGL